MKQSKGHAENYDKKKMSNEFFRGNKNDHFFSTRFHCTLFNATGLVPEPEPYQWTPAPHDLSRAGEIMFQQMKYVWIMAHINGQVYIFLYMLPK